MDINYDKHDNYNIDNNNDDNNNNADNSNTSSNKRIGIGPEASGRPARRENAACRFIRTCISLSLYIYIYIHICIYEHVTCCFVLLPPCVYPRCI